MNPVAELSPEAARSRLHELLVVDVREPHEFDGPLGHIPGASLTPLGKLDARADSLPADRPILAVCRSGKRSQQACRILAAHGRDATNLAGGMIAWNRAGLPAERREAASLAEARDAITAWLAELSGRAPADARDAIGSALVAAGASWETPSAAGLHRALEDAAAALAAGTRPPDLDVSLDFFRKTLAIL